LDCLPAIKTKLAWHESFNELVIAVETIVGELPFLVGAKKVWQEEVKE